MKYDKHLARALLSLTNLLVHIICVVCVCVVFYFFPHLKIDMFVSRAAVRIGVK